MGAEVLVAVISLVSAICAYLAGRNRWLVKALDASSTAYQELIADLRLEIDRLKAEVSELRTLLSNRPRTTRKS